VLSDVLGRFGVEIDLVDYDRIGAIEAALTPQTRLVVAETISNPGMELADIPTLARLAHRAGALLLVDNTFATPVFCRPLEHGADLVVHSAGKFLNGHSDVTAGVIVGSSTLLATIRQTAYLTGPTLDPFDAWLTLRGIRTLAPRMTWASQTAATIATFLESHPAVTCVRYPGLPSEGRRQLTHDLLPCGAGSVLVFEPVGGPDVAERVIERLRTIPYVPSIGGTMTIVSFPAMVPEVTGCVDTIAASYQSGLIRLSVGLEDPSELMADLDQALNGAASVGG
jgi:methionine-gamma-lyase